MKRSYLKRAGKKTNQWTSARKKLKKIFEAKGITRCELCGSDFGLSFAHSKKRRFITTESDLMEVALLCVVHHEEIEYSGNMFNRITEIIESRD